MEKVIKANDDIRRYLRKHNMKQWQLGDLLGVSEYTIVRKLRHELSIEEKAEIIKLIENEGSDDLSTQ